MSGRDGKPETDHRSDRRDAAHGNLDDVLRQIGLDILQEDVPERLRGVLRREADCGGKATVDRSPDYPGQGDGTQGRDGEASD